MGGWESQVSEGYEPGVGGSSVGEQDTSSVDSGSQEELAGDWELQVADRGYSSIAGQTQEDSDAGAMASMSDILDRDPEETSKNLVDQFGIVGYFTALSRYGFISATLGAVVSIAPDIVKELTTYVVEMVLSRITLSVAAKIAVATNPALGIAVAIIGLFSVNRFASNLGNKAHDSALEANPNQSAYDFIEGLQGSGDYVDFDKVEELKDVTMGEVQDLLNELIADGVDLTNSLYYQRNNIIGTGSPVV